MAGLAQGGGLGIFGDFLFGSASRTGSSLPETVAGPVLGDLSQTIFKIWNDIKDPQGKHPGRKTAADVVRLINNEIPFTNLFYLRGLWNYYVLWQIQNAINPGYLQRHEQRAKQQRGVTYWLSPSQAAR